MSYLSSPKNTGRTGNDIMNTRSQLHLVANPPHPVMRRVAFRRKSYREWDEQVYNLCTGKLLD